MILQNDQLHNESTWTWLLDNRWVKIWPMFLELLAIVYCQIYKDKQVQLPLRRSVEFCNICA